MAATGAIERDSTSQLQFPSFPYEPRPEFAVRLGRDELEAGTLVD